MPHPQHEWDAFFALIKAGNAKEALCWDPLTKKPQVTSTAEHSRTQQGTAAQHTTPEQSRAEHNIGFYY
jgi:hypothetical protein